MNRSAYLTTGLAIKALANLSKAEISLHGKENIPPGPTIFVINHFTRIETFLLPYTIYNLTNTPVCSLAHASLFQGGLGRFFDLIGVLSTANPQRDEIIVKSLLTGEANWVIFPEGSMVKTKQIMQGSTYMITDPKGMRKPHTGAAALALRCELFRRYLLHKGRDNQENARNMLNYLNLHTLEDVRSTTASIVPVNLTYYPLRARENIISTLAAKMVKDIPERMIEEIMLEGTMLLSGVDIDIHFGKPIEIAPYLDFPVVQKELRRQEMTGFLMSAELKKVMQQLAGDIMQRYMHDIYAMTTVNHEHLFASFLRLYPFKRISIESLKRRVFYAATLLGERKLTDICLHKSLENTQAHLLTDDRYGKFKNFLRLAIDTGVVRQEGTALIQDRSRLSAALSFHRGRIDNPVEIIANEAEPLTSLRKLLLSLAWQPDFLLRSAVVCYLLKKEKSKYAREYAVYANSTNGLPIGQNGPYLLPSYRCRTGVILIHSYLAGPAEVRTLARYLQKQGLWVYVPRLAGHGTSAHDLAGRRHQEWIDDVETGYVIIQNICNRIVLGGISSGASIAFDLAARITDIAGVFAVCPPLLLQDYATGFMPAIDVWNRLVKKLRGSDTPQFFQLMSDNPDVQYSHNPYTSIREMGHLLDTVAEKLENVRIPALVIEAENDPVIAPQGTRKVFDKLGSTAKRLNIFSASQHNMMNDDRSMQLYRSIHTFIETLSSS